ncbi:hypothetical protein GALMADRAFT_143287 [Galerina marginata CBS 339.88]|uniref:Uncharacterized protein n=1 Tax=Galerina marginata (strain CBS 339.88) TaxID=685588 RepID=A0A067SNH3_GALM3|nr:hypothetical protein GALMADRAFT_143287 [Galerina marginata CBS 339.88]
MCATRGAGSDPGSHDNFVYQLRRLPFRSFNTPSYTDASGVLQHWSPQQRPLRSSRCCTPFKTGNRGASWAGVCINPDASPPVNPLQSTALEALFMQTGFPLSEACRNRALRHRAKPQAQGLSSPARPPAYRNCRLAANARPPPGFDLAGRPDCCPWAYAQPSRLESFLCIPTSLLSYLSTRLNTWTKWSFRAPRSDPGSLRIRCGLIFLTVQFSWLQHSNSFQIHIPDVRCYRIAYLILEEGLRIVVTYMPRLHPLGQVVTATDRIPNRR